MMALSKLHARCRNPRFDEDSLLTEQNGYHSERIRTRTAQNEPEHAFQARGNRTMLVANDVAYLKPGDHVAWHRPWLIWHHAIVLDTDVKTSKVHVIHWGKNQRNKTEIVKEWLDVNEEFGQFYRIDYEKDITVRIHQKPLYREPFHSWVAQTMACLATIANRLRHTVRWAV